MNWQDYDRHCHWMAQALVLAEQAGDAGEVPVGAVLVAQASQTLIAVGENRRERDQDPTAHAEILALRQGGLSQGNWHLNHCTLYVTLEPCPMCSGAIVLARLGALVYGADDPKAGAIQTVLNLPDSPASNHRLPVLKGILEPECRSLLQRWFAQRRGHPHARTLPSEPPSAVQLNTHSDAPPQSSSGCAPPDNLAPKPS